MAKWVKPISKIVTVVGSILLALCLAFGVIGKLYGDVINDWLQIKTTTSKDNSDGSTDTEYYKSQFKSIEELLDNKYELIKRICEEGAVLLKNENNALPLKSTEKKVSLFGRNSTNFVYGTSNGAAQVTVKNCDTLDTVFASFGITVNPTLWDLYKNSTEPSRSVGETRYTVGELPETAYTDVVRGSYSQYKDAAFVVLSRVNGEGSDFFRTTDSVRDGDGQHVVLGLQDRERAAIAEAKKCSEKVIVLLNSDYPMEIEELKNDPEVDAILWTGSTGVNGVYGTVRTIVGQSSPSGKLTDTYAVSSLSSPAMQNFGEFQFANADSIQANHAGYYVIYQEGIYIGYKYYETRYEDTVLGQGNATANVGVTNGTTWNYEDEVSYSFGYGLTYTTFKEEITDWSIDVSAKKAQMKVSVTNTGDFAAKHVVQLYAQSPYTQYDIDNKVEKAAIQLLDFEKTDTIQPGETVEVTLNIDLYLLASYDSHNAKTYIWDAGDYYFALGNGAHDALNNVLAAKEKTTDDGMDYDGNAELVKHYHHEEFDATTFKKSVTGVDVTNHMDDADINYYGIEVTYLTRNHWDTTYPTAQTGLSANDAIKEALKDGASYTPDESSKDFSDVVSGVNYNNKSTSYSIVEMRGLAYNDPKWEDLLNQMTIEEISGTVAQARVGAFPVPSVGFSGSSQSDGPAGIRNTYLAEDSKYKISATMFESECILASTFSKELARLQGEMFGEDGLWTDVSSAWAPGSNTHRTPYNGRNTEYFSECGTLAGIMGREECIGAAKYGVAMAPKHFAFNDQETQRNGVATFFTEQAGREIILRAFELPFSSGVNVGTMTSENRIGCYFSGANYEVLHNVVRVEWGMNGGAITDMIGGANQVKYADGPASSIAGITMFNCNNATLYAGATGAMREEVILADATLFKAVRENCHRNLYMWANSNAMNGVSKDSTVVFLTPWWHQLEIALDVIFAVVTAVGIAGMVLPEILKKKEEEE